MEKNFVVAHLSMTGSSTGARLLGRQSRVVAVHRDAASRSCHARVLAIKATRGRGREPPSGPKPRALPPLSERATLPHPAFTSHGSHRRSPSTLDVAEAVELGSRSHAAPLH
jgi:hypothetical protein